MEMLEQSAENGLLVPSHWNPHWNYHLGGEPRSVCACPDGPYEGARLVTTPRFCERCGGLVAVTPPDPKPDHDLTGALDGRAIVAAINALTDALARVLPPADPAFACRVCDYTSDEYGDTHTHAERHEAVGEPGAGEGRD